MGSFIVKNTFINPKDYLRLSVQEKIKVDLYSLILLVIN